MIQGVLYEWNAKQQSVSKYKVKSWKKIEIIISYMFQCVKAT